MACKRTDLLDRLGNRLATQPLSSAARARFGAQMVLEQAAQLDEPPMPQQRTARP